MLVLITYDVCVSDDRGLYRLRQIAKYCQKFGQRVQNSVFECVVDESKFMEIKNELLKLMDEEKDSIRFYKLGNNYKNKVEHYGIKVSYDMTDVFMV